MKNGIIFWFAAILSGYSSELTKTKIGFILEHFVVRGTEVSTFDYADYNETLLGNESYILYLNIEEAQKHISDDTSSEVKTLFRHRFASDHFFDCKSIEEINDVLAKEKIDLVYWQVCGGLDPRIAEIHQRTAIHAVFFSFVPQGHIYAAISKWLTLKDHSTHYTSTVPYIVRPPENLASTLHEELHIPRDAIVFGRHGGYHQFSIQYAKEAVVELAQEHKDWYFLFLNTAKFCELPNVIYLDKTWNAERKEKFINTCDAMIHAREDGETFGLACAEFSIRNKPVITCFSGDLAHLDILGSKALIYTNKHELKGQLGFCASHRERIRSMNWDAYSASYSPATVMNQFNQVFIKSE